MSKLKVCLVVYCLAVINCLYAAGNVEIISCEPYTFSAASLGGISIAGANGANGADGGIDSNGDPTDGLDGENGENGGSLYVQAPIIYITEGVSSSGGHGGDGGKAGSISCAPNWPCTSKAGKSGNGGNGGFAGSIIFRANKIYISPNVAFELSGGSGGQGPNGVDRYREADDPPCPDTPDSGKGVDGGHGGDGGSSGKFLIIANEVNGAANLSLIRKGGNAGNGGNGGDLYLQPTSSYGAGGGSKGGDAGRPGCGCDLDGSTKGTPGIGKSAWFCSGPVPGEDGDSPDGCTAIGSFPGCSGNVIIVPETVFCPEPCEGENCPPPCPGPNCPDPCIDGNCEPCSGPNCEPDPPEPCTGPECPPPPPDPCDTGDCPVIDPPGPGLPCGCARVDYSLPGATLSNPLSLNCGQTASDIFLRDVSGCTHSYGAIKLPGTTIYGHAKIWEFQPESGKKITLTAKSNMSNYWIKVFKAPGYSLVTSSSSWIGQQTTLTWNSDGSKYYIVYSVDGDCYSDHYLNVTCENIPTPTCPTATDITAGLVLPNGRIFTTAHNVTPNNTVLTSCHTGDGLYTGRWIKASVPPLTTATLTVANCGSESIGTQLFLEHCGAKIGGCKSGTKRVSSSWYNPNTTTKTLVMLVDTYATSPPPTMAVTFGKTVDNDELEFARLSACGETITGKLINDATYSSRHPLSDKKDAWYLVNVPPATKHRGMHAFFDDGSFQAYTDNRTDENIRLTYAGNNTWYSLWNSKGSSSGAKYGSDRDIFSMRSINNGNSWDWFTVLNKDALTDGREDTFVEIGANQSGTAIATWSRGEPVAGIGNTWVPYFTRTTDGLKWSDPKPMHSSLVTDNYHDYFIKPQPGANGVWGAMIRSDVIGSTTTYLRFIRSTDGGITWSAPTLIYNNPIMTTGGGNYPVAATDNKGNWVVIAEVDTALSGSGSDYDIVAFRSADDGLTWSSMGLVNSDGMSDSTTDSRPAIATNGLGVWGVVWQNPIQPDTTSGDWEVYCSFSTDNGATWSNQKIVNTDAATDTGADQKLSISIDKFGNSVVSWRRIISGSTAVMAARSSNNGSTWTAPVAMLASNANNVSTLETTLWANPNGTHLATFEQKYGTDIDVAFGRASFSATGTGSIYSSYGMLNTPNSYIDIRENTSCFYGTPIFTTAWDRVVPDGSTVLQHAAPEIPPAGGLYYVRIGSNANTPQQSVRFLCFDKLY